MDNFKNIKNKCIFRDNEKDSKTIFFLLYFILREKLAFFKGDVTIFTEEFYFLEGKCLFSQDTFCC